jgi:DNA-binding MarR family transcriptional regulator
MVTMRKTTPTPIGKLLNTLTKRYIGIVSEKLAHLPIERYYFVLLLIGRNNKVLSQKDLVRILETDKVSVNRIVDYLEEHQVIKRTVDPLDRRCQLLSITDLGEPFLDEIEQAFAATDRLFENTISDMSLSSSLQTLVQHISKESGKAISFYYDQINSNDEK